MMRDEDSNLGMLLDGVAETTGLAVFRIPYLAPRANSQIE
jgi:hypothetical protein